MALKPGDKAGVDAFTKYRYLALNLINLKLKQRLDIKYQKATMRSPSKTPMRTNHNLNGGQQKHIAASGTASKIISHCISIGRKV